MVRASGNAPDPGTDLVRCEVISSPALFELRAQKMAECRGLAPLARRHALFSKQARFACPVGIPKMVRVAGLAPATFPFERDASAVPGCYTRLVLPVDLHPELSDLKSLGVC